MQQSDRWRALAGVFDYACSQSRTTRGTFGFPPVEYMDRSVTFSGNSNFPSHFQQPGTGSMGKRGKTTPGESETKESLLILFNTCHGSEAGHLSHWTLGSLSLSLPLIHTE